MTSESASAPPAPPLVTLTDVQVTLGGKTVLAGITTVLRRREITALIGLNGSGKTTLLRTLLGEYRYRGSIRFHCGHDHSKPKPEHIGYVPQKLHTDARLPLTVCDFLALALQRRPLFLGISRKTRQIMQQLLRDVGAEHLMNAPVEKLSGGELQRVLLGLALHPKPELLLLDEPAAGIDFRDQRMFYDLIAEANQKWNVTVLLVSHELSVVNHHAHHVLCLRDGQIQCEGEPRKILTGETLASVFGAEQWVYTHHHPPLPRNKSESG